MPAQMLWRGPQRRQRAAAEYTRASLPLMLAILLALAAPIVFPAISL